MKNKLLLLASAALLTITLAGCGSLLPKKVEFGQRKVQAVPELPDKAVDHQRQAAEYVAAKTEETKDAALATDADKSVLVPAVQAATVASVLSESLGPPLLAFKPRVETNSAPELATILRTDQAKLNKAVAKYSNTVEKDVGKKIEGTGWLQVGYFSYLIGIGVLVLLAYGAVKIYGMINPGVGLGVNAVTGVAGAAIHKGFSELVAGGEAFVQYVKNSPLTADTKAYVQSLFVQAHTSNQSPDTQKIVNQLTDNPSAIVAPTIAPVPAGSQEAAPAPVIPPAPEPSVPTGPVSATH